MKYGLSEDDVRELIQHQLDKNPDLKYYLNNPYLEELVSLLIDGISHAIVINSERVIQDMEWEARVHGKTWGG